MQSRLTTVLSLFACMPVFAQGVDSRPKFQVAAVRLCNGTEPRAILSGSPGRLSLPCWGLFRIIQEAYQTFADGTANFMHQPAVPITIEGFPNQMSSERYSIEAKVESPQSMAMMRGPMMQRLLEERFRMQAHREIREGPAYMMSVAKGGSKLQAATDDSCDPSPPADFIPSLALPPGGKPRCGVLTPPTRRGTHFILDERGVTIEAFAKLFQIGGLPVIDRTGIVGTFDIHLEWESSPPEPVLPGGDGAAESPDTSIISSIRKQLGLQLTPGKGPREFLVIGRLERPAAN